MPLSPEDLLTTTVCPSARPRVTNAYV
jgi:hypothetical protein